ncbi:HlyD family secretion protein [Chitinophaga sedimenti]|uniref:HlyD family secretion protein n=1 Tax=Chitinophaga sedimenti TaxID=2033606 RepID=UPI002002C0D5|nr:HlyD family secretion protein [Chitinophaga sedimenti]MCK7557433.1 HlyD family secretion protein [Chitinophaga sedimenti]
METANNATPRKGKLIMRIVFIGILVVGAIYGVKTWMYARHHETTDNAQIEGHAAPVIARVAGYIKSLNIRDYGAVKRGDTLVVIDDEEYKIALQQAQADYAQAEADLETAKASMTNASATLKMSQTNAQVALVKKDKSTADLRRDQALFNDQAITNRQLDDTKANSLTNDKTYQAALDQIELSKAGISVAASKIKQAEAILASKKAAVDQAALKLTYTHILAPANGKIGKKPIEAGQFVQAGQNLFTVIDGNGFYVVANFKETQIPNIQLGQEAEVEIDGYPDKLIGKVMEISQATGAKFSLLPPDNATGNFVKIVQRVPVKILLEDADKYAAKLRAGLSVEVAIKH